MKRNYGLWFPRIPDANLNLNENSYSGNGPSTGDFEPLCWTLFGGPGGIYLRSLTGISVAFWGGSLTSIEFHYDTEEGGSIPLECSKLGRHKPSAYARVIDFSIDGSGGEIINSVEFVRGYNCFDRPVDFIFLKVSCI